MNLRNDFFLTVSDDDLQVVYKDHHGKQAIYVIQSQQDYKRFFTSALEELGITPGELNIMASSSLDFPEEFTNNREVIKLCKALRTFSQ